jgi:hypothetical protein
MFPYGMFFASLMNFDSAGTEGKCYDAKLWGVFVANLLLTPLYVVGSVVCQTGYVISYPVRLCARKLRSHFSKSDYFALRNNQLGEAEHIKR